MEIRFRVWDGEEMWYPEDGAPYTLSQKGNIWHDRWGDYRLNDAKPPTAMLSTGLKDKNGKEIWEGDIYRVNKDYGFTCTITWSDKLATFALRSVNDGTDRAGSWWIDSTLEHIGNIHENPELLEEVA